MNPYQQIATGGKIWKFMPDPACENVALEIRDSNLMEAYWLIFPAFKEEQIQAKISLPNSWTMTILHHYDGVLLLGRYEGLGMPVIKGVYAFSQYGQLLWQNSDWGWIKGNAGCGWFKAGEEIRITSLVSGVIVAEPDNQKYNFGLEMPQLIESPAYIKNAIPGSPAEVLEKQAYTVISYHEADSKFSQIIKVIKNGAEVFSEKLSTDNNGISLDTWGIWKDHLFYIRGKETWVGLDLSSLKS